MQDPRDAIAPSMPRNALRAVQADYIVPLTEIAAVLTKLAGSEAVDGIDMVDSRYKKVVGVETQMANDNLSQVGSAGLGEPSLYTCPDCHGAMLKVHAEPPLRFRCHTGHAFTAETLAATLAETTEQSLWICIRLLQETRGLYHYLAQQEEGETKADLLRCAEDADKRANRLRETLLTPEPDPAANSART